MYYIYLIINTYKKHERNRRGMEFRKDVANQVQSRIIPPKLIIVINVLYKDNMD